MTTYLSVTWHLGAGVEAAKLTLLIPPMNRMLKQIRIPVSRYF
jgi:hypothetical protein